MELILDVLLWGAITGLIHYVVMGALYANPIVGKVYAQAMQFEPGVKKWDSKPRYLFTQFLGTQIEVYILTIAFFGFRPCIGVQGLPGALLLGALLACVRVYPRSWNMWIQSSYPNRLIWIESINGVLSTVTIMIALQLLV